MKYLKLFESHDEIDTICNKYGIKNYRINPDGTVDVRGDVNLSNKSLWKIRVKFNSVTGDFNCDKNSLISLEGCW